MAAARTAAALALGLSVCAAVPAQQPEEPLAPLVITTPRLQVAPVDAPAAVTVVDPLLQQQGAQELTLDEPLARVPGVFAQNRYNYAQGLRLSVRGFGARSMFGVRGLRVLVDGFPLTLPDGQTQLDGLDLTLIDRIEVVRGPFSSAYGNASGGVVHILTQQAPVQPTVRGQIGAYGLREGAARGGVEVGEWNLFGGLRGLHSDGYRQHSEAELYSLYGKARYEFSESASLTTIVNASSRRAQDPGGLTAEQWQAERRQARVQNVQYNAGEAAEQQRIGWLFRDRLDGAGDEFSARAFLGRREFENRLPFTAGGQVAFDRISSGFGLQRTLQRALWGRPNRTALGIDAEHMRDDRRRYDNLEGTRGELTLDQIETVGAVGLYAENELALRDRLTLTLGLRYDHVRLEVEDRFGAPADAASGRRGLEEWSWLAGLSYALGQSVRVYGNLATVFETPTTNELANPAGRGFNPELEAQTALNTEVGLKGSWRHLDYDLAVFSIRLDNELIPYQLEDQPGRTYYRNAGESRREGVELGADYWLDDQFRLSAAYTYSDFRFRDFLLEGVQFAGNRIPGLPREQLFAELGYDGRRHFASLNGLYIGRVQADNANSEAAGGYLVANARLGRRQPLGGLGEWKLFGGINNLLDRDFAANIRINDPGRRFYEPAPKRHWYLGLEVAL